MKTKPVYTQTIHSAAAMHEVAAVLARHVREGDVLVLMGDLGAGKTQFTQGLAQGLGVSAPVTSPTFNILLSYVDGRLPLNHFDLYRLDDETELEDIGFYDALEDGGIAVIEWGDKFPSAMPDSYLALTITSDEQGVRTLMAEAVGDEATELVAAWAADADAGFDGVKCAADSVADEVGIVGEASASEGARA